MLRRVSPESALIGLCLLFSVAAFVVIDRSSAHASGHPREAATTLTPDRPSTQVVTPQRSAPASQSAISLG